jgi:small subunit ribosomal protein S18
VARDQRRYTRDNRDNFRDNRDAPFRSGFRRRRKRSQIRMDQIDYKNTEILRGFMTDRGKLLPRRVSGNCAKHQRQVTRAIKRARNIALVPFTTQQ